MLRGIKTALDLRDMDEDWAKQLLTITGWRTVMELRGIPCIDESSAPTPWHTLVSSRSFGQRVESKEDLAEALTAFTTRALERLRKERLLACGIVVHIRSSKFGEERYNESLHIPLPEASQDTREFLRAAMQGLDRLYKEGVPYAKLVSCW